MKYTKEQIAKVARECAKQEALHDNEYLGKIGCMLDDLLGCVAELERFKAAYEEWHQKTEWVQETATYKELGKHRADVLRDRIAELEKDAARMDWMQDNYLCADFMYGEPATEIVAIEFPSKSTFCGDLRIDVDTAMQKD